MTSPLTGKHLKSFQESTAAYNIWKGSVSSGKTVASGVFRWVDFCLSGPPGELLMVGKTELTLKRNVIDLLISNYGDNIQLRGHEVRIFGRRCYMVGASDERAEQKIRGLSLVGAYCDEISLFPESFVQMLKNRLRIRGAKLFATMNPDSPNHYINKDLIYNEEIKDKQVFVSTMEDNPYLDPEYVTRMKTAYPKTSMWYKRYILGIDCLAEGAVYDFFDEEKHVFDEIGEYDYYYITVDYGTANPCVFLLCGVNGGSLDVIKEYYYDGGRNGHAKTDLQYAEDMIAFTEGYKIREVLVDPSALSFITQLRKSGFPVRQAKNDVLDGIRTVARMIENEQLFIHESCKNTIREMQSYVWDSKAQLKGIDQPLKQDDHGPDALRYGAFTLFGKGQVQAINNPFRIR